MQQILAVNNMYAAYTANSSNADKKNVSELSRLLKGKDMPEKQEKQANPELMMDKLIISKEALQLLRSSI